MSDKIRVLYASHDSSASLCPVTDFGPETAETVRRFHRSFPEYAPSALHQLSSLAEKLGVAEIMVKDESTRVGLNAFKVLGGSYAIGHHIAGMLGIDPTLMTRDLLISEDTRKKLGELTFITATDGNHGRGVAWTAKQLRQHCVVYMPAGTAAERLENIRRLGADASIPGPGYDDCVRLAAKHARENGWVLTQDTSWNGYEEIPLRIMQGYTTMALEAAEQLGDTMPTHVFLQAGVGSMAGAVAAFLAALAIGCSTQNKLNSIRRNEISPTLSLAQENEVPEIDIEAVRRDTLTVRDENGKEILIMRATLDENGDIRESIPYEVLAAHIWWQETKTAYGVHEKQTTFLGVHENVAYALLYNGILHDRSVGGGNVLTAKTLKIIKDDIGASEYRKLVIYGEWTKLGVEVLKDEKIEFRQTPYDVMVRK